MSVTLAYLRNDIPTVPNLRVTYSYGCKLLHLFLENFLDRSLHANSASGHLGFGFVTLNTIFRST